MPAPNLPPLPWPPTSYPDEARLASAHAIEAMDDCAALRADLEMLIALADNAARGARLTVVDGEPYVTVHGARWALLRRVAAVVGDRLDGVA